MQVGVGTEFENKIVIEAVCGNNHALVLTDEGEVFGWGQGILKDSKSSGSEGVKYIKSSNVGTKLEHVESIHKFLLKKKAPKVSKSLRYYSQRCSPEKIVEISTLSSNKHRNKDQKCVNNLQKASLLRNNLANPKVSFSKKQSIGE